MGNKIIRMMKISKDSLEFLNKLSVNNNRKWFETNKETEIIIKSEISLILNLIFSYIK